MVVIDVRAALETRLPSARLVRLRQVQQLAADLRSSAYLVGGFVRDLLLGKQLGDFDLVVQTAGEAAATAGPRLALALARRHGGDVTVHSAFGTASWVDPDGEVIDLATARTETYVRPAALPEVLPAASILADLSRRDFTVNALAIRIDGESFGEVLDPYQGQDDLTESCIRVLHLHSFQDDPTRIFRGVRYERRLGFQLSDETVALIPGALPVIPALSGERIRHELELIFREPNVPAMLARLAQLGVLRAVHPALDWGQAQLTRAAVVSSLPIDVWQMTGRLDLEIIYLALLLLTAAPDDVGAVLTRLCVRREVNEAVPAALNLRLASTLPSEVVAQLDQVSPMAVATAFVLYPSARATLDRYLAHWRFVGAEMTGTDLLALGLEPGSQFRSILWGLRAARLDGAVVDRAGELALVRQWVKTE
jgi:tRNA nucleotidyltransferase (CCA-adding enzyme)